MSLYDILWNLPAAIAYQLQIIAQQMQGYEFYPIDSFALADVKRRRFLNRG